MTGAISTPRYSHEDFETASVRSAAPSYVSNAPSYHSTAQNADAAPAYAPRTGTSSATNSPARNETSTPRPQVGLPPIPPASPQTAMTLHNFRIPSWSANNAVAARHYRNVAERRITDGRYLNDLTRRNELNDRPLENQNDGADEIRPLEDPYLVGEVAAAQARRERLARESGDDVLIREDRQWDWLLAQMKDWDERERSWARFRREVDNGQRKKLLRRIGGRLLS
ncbi:hypothetical protein TOPH_05437 [Tolypocladium ophioglossoides CBS 100239]|uniref:Uncharacterized protein n=1 Tax=Tolypocladium ophioglossoides (strain CBS 100239) TaxID=1163406 RepID=A0A0L0N6Q8_TOLOC|nr:hypothetical protein TOPH_05437 [Tolypocladium ophioglossoides CBS 100239]